jgi:hypothetical protein
VENIVEILDDFLVEKLRDTGLVLTTRPLVFYTQLFLEKEKKRRKREVGKSIPQ